MHIAATMPISQSSQEVWEVTKGDHPGSSEADIAAEPDWGNVSNEHYPGFKNKQGRRPGFVREDEHEDWEYGEDFQEDQAAFLQAKRAADSKSGRLINWQDAVRSEKAGRLNVALLPALSRFTGHLIVSP